MAMHSVFGSLRIGVIALLLAACTVTGTHAQNADGPTSEPGEAPDPELVPAQPPADLPTSTELGELLPGSMQDPLSNRSLSRRIAQLYRQKAQLIEADAAGRSDKFERLLTRTMQELRRLAREPKARAHPRFRSLYESIVQEYEGYYGSRDSVTIAKGSIFSYRDTLFASLEQLEEPLLEDVMIPSIPSMTTTVPMDVNRLVKQSISYLLEDPDKHLYTWMSRSSTYFPMIEKVLREEGVPSELKYLAMIESGLNPRAQSWASAVGMWQFMRGTARLYDLRINHWVDERRDPEASTRAAAQHLKHLYKMFDDWLIAIGAYNCGQGNMQKALRLARRYKGVENPSFWDAWEYLPRETRNYVPMYVAASLVVSNQEKFDLKEVEPGPDYEYDRVPITGMIDLETIADLAETTEATIRALNPELRRWTTPPADGAYEIRIPLGNYSEFAEAYAELPDKVKRTVKRYRVKSGDTLGEIAGQYGVSIGALRRANGIRGHIIRVGQELMIPVPSYDEGSSEQVADAQPVSVRYETNEIRPIRLASASGSGGSGPSTSIEQLASEANGTADEDERASSSAASQSTAETDDEPADVRASEEEETAEEDAEDEEAQTASASEAESAEQPDKITYRVRPGDTIIEIADRHDVWVRDLRDWNNLHGHMIQVGQELTIYTSKEAGQRAQAETSGDAVTYRVRPGDTISEIAVRYGVGTSEIRRWNRISGSRIHVGQQLTIYPDSENAGADQTYQVRYGDSLSVIADKHGVTVRQLKQWNDLRGNTIRPGQELQVSG